MFRSHVLGIGQTGHRDTRVPYHPYGCIGTVILCPYKLTTGTCVDFLLSQQLVLAMTLSPEFGGQCLGSSDRLFSFIHASMYSFRKHPLWVFCVSSLIPDAEAGWLSSQGVRWRFNFFQVEPGCVGEKGFVAGAGDFVHVFPGTHVWEHWLIITSRTEAWSVSPPHPFRVLVVQLCSTLCDPMDCSSISGVPRQEYWNG